MSENSNGNDNRPLAASQSEVPIGPVYDERSSMRPAARRPRKYWKLGLFLLVAGAVVGGVGYAMGGSGAISVDRDGFHVDSSDTSEDVYIYEDDLPAFSYVDVESSSSEIEFIESDHYGIEMNLPARHEVDWDLSNNRLKVNRSKDNFNLQLMNFSFDFDRYYIRVFYPEGAEFEEVKLDTSSGGINAAVANAKEVDLHSSSGGISLVMNEVGSLKADASSGSISIEGNGESHTDAYVHASSGGIDIVGGKWTDLEVDSSSGSIDINAEMTGETKIKASSGSVDVNAETNGDYGYDVETGSGSIHINGERYNDDVKFNTDQDNLFNIRASSGSVTLNVEN